MIESDFWMVQEQFDNIRVSIVAGPHKCSHSIIRFGIHINVPPFWMVKEQFDYFCMSFEASSAFLVLFWIFLKLSLIDN